MSKKKSKSTKSPSKTKSSTQSTESFPPLDPKNDAVFKALFVDPEMKQALIALVTAVIKPNQPIADLKVLNPEISIKYFNHRGCILDILVELDNGTFVDIEMQMKRDPTIKQRSLHYWGRIYTDSLKKSQFFSQGHPTVVIFFLNHIDFVHRPQVAHHRYFVTHELDPNDKLKDLRLDFVELPKIPLAKQADFADKVLVRWCQFFLNPNHPELQGEFMADKNLKKAKERLLALSGEPSIRELARMRDKAAYNWAITMQAATEQGLEIGREEGREKGREEGRKEGELKQRTLLIRNILLSDLGAEKSVADLAKIVGCSEEEILAVKKSLVP